MTERSRTIDQVPVVVIERSTAAIWEEAGFAGTNREARIQSRLDRRCLTRLRLAVVPKSVR